MALVQQQKRQDLEVPRNGRGQPLIKILTPSKLKRDKGKLVEKLVPYTRVTTWIDCLDDKTNLMRWQRRMILVGLAGMDYWDRETLISEILAAAGDRDKLNDIAERLHELAGGNEKAKKGTWLHHVSEDADRQIDLPSEVSDADRLDMAAYLLATRDLKIKEIERFVVLDDYKVGGTPDRLSFYDGLDPDGCPAGHVITDLKTGNVDYNPGKIGSQLAGYTRGKFYDHRTGSRTDLPEDINLRWGLTIHLPAGSGVCDIKWTDLTLGWEGFQLAGTIRDYRRRSRRVFQPYPFINASTEDADDDDWDE